MHNKVIKILNYHSSLNYVKKDMEWGGRHIGKM